LQLRNWQIGRIRSKAKLAIGPTGRPYQVGRKYTSCAIPAHQNGDAPAHGSAHSGSCHDSRATSHSGRPTPEYLTLFFCAFLPNPRLPPGKNTQPQNTADMMSYMGLRTNFQPHITGGFRTHFGIHILHGGFRRFADPAFRTLGRTRARLGNPGLCCTVAMKRRVHWGNEIGLAPVSWTVEGLGSGYLSSLAS
jgi:hypothetical protein